MAITAAALQAEFGTNPMNAQVLQSFQANQGTLQQWYVIGNMDAPGRARLVTTTAADDAATQAAAVLVQLRSS